MTKTLRVTDPRELLALIPFQLGFTPSDSIVVVSLRGEQKQVGLIARVDAQAVTSDDCAEVLEQLKTHCSQDGAARLVVVGYGSNELGLLELQGALVAASRTLSETFKIDEVLVVWGNQYGHLSHEKRCLPVPTKHVTNSRGFTRDLGLDLALCWEHSASTERLKSTQVAAHLVFEGAVARPQRAWLGQVQASDEKRQTAVLDEIKMAESRYDAHDGWRLREFARWETNVLDRGSHSEANGKCRPQRVHQSEETGELPVDFVATLAVALRDVTFRDAVLVSFTSLGQKGGRNLICAFENGLDERDIADDIAKRAIAEITHPEMGMRSDSTKIAAVREALTAVVADAPVDYHSAPRALLSLIAWWEGSGALARRHLEELARFDADYSLAKLVTMALDYGLAPGWLRKRGAAR